jgi:hypothetical protein
VTSPQAYWKRALLLEQPASSRKAELDSLTVDDRADLDRWAEEELRSIDSLAA